MDITLSSPVTLSTGSLKRGPDESSLISPNKSSQRAKRSCQSVSSMSHANETIDAIAELHTIINKQQSEIDYLQTSLNSHHELLNSVLSLLGYNKAMVMVSGSSSNNNISVSLEKSTTSTASASSSTAMSTTMSMSTTSASTTQLESLQQLPVICKLRNNMDYVLSYLELSDSNVATNQQNLQDTNTSNRDSIQPLIFQNSNNQSSSNLQSSYTEIVKTGTKTHPTKTARSVAITAVYIDQNEKKRRATTLVISGLPLNSGLTDHDSTIGLLESEFNIRPVIVTTKRLGQPVQGRIQPLLVTLRSEETTQQIIKLAKQLRHSSDNYIRANVFINANLTRAESEAAYQVRERRRRSAASASATSTTYSGRQTTSDGPTPMSFSTTGSSWTGSNVPSSVYVNTIVGGNSATINSGTVDNETSATSVTSATVNGVNSSLTTYNIPVLKSSNTVIAATSSHNESSFITTSIPGYQLPCNQSTKVNTADPY